ncbi:YwiC-like family protein [Paenibacillus taiwanensis]|uniref:YwiC-like family protein n=1 Tax=Paenibacillus taiwanensis TaxID=401638 RepID=UPI0004258B24|nr:YwiC-like family protein [Paenibacillus taiwanensis]
MALQAKNNKQSAMSIIPNQHGAWAMLIIPFLLGMLAAKPNWTHLWLAIAWFSAYCGSFAFLQGVKTSKYAAYKKAYLVWGTMLLVSVIILLSCRVDIWWMGVVMLPCYLVHMWFAKRKHERHFVNDAIAVLQFCWMLVIAFEVGGGTAWSLAWRLCAACVLYFVGTIFYVKTMIREKGNKNYYIGSVTVHIVAGIAVGLLLSPWLALPFGVLFFRAVWMPCQRVTIKQVGISEIVFSVMTACSLVLCI